MTGLKDEITEYGVRYQNGEEDWNTRRWFGHIETPDMRASFTEQYDLRMSGFGMPKLPLVFLTRTKTTTYSETGVVDDTTTPETVPVPGPGEGSGEGPGLETPPGQEQPAPEQPAEGTEVTKEGAINGTE